MEGVCLDRLPKQRSALPQQGILLDIPPQRGGLGSLPVAADCFATQSRALSGLLFKPDKLPAGLTQARRSRQLWPHYGSTNEQGSKTSSSRRIFEAQKRSHQEGGEGQEITPNRGPNAAVFSLFRRSLLADDVIASTVSVDRPLGACRMQRKPRVIFAH